MNCELIRISPSEAALNTRPCSSPTWSISAMAWTVTKQSEPWTRPRDSPRFKVILAAQGEYPTALGVAAPLVRKVREL